MKLKTRLEVIKIFYNMECDGFDITPSLRWKCIFNLITFDIYPLKEKRSKNG